MHEPVLITETEFRKGETVFSAGEDLRIQRAPPQEEPLAAAVRAHGARAVVVGSQPYRGPLYEALAANRGEGPALVVRFGVGHDNLDKPQARRYGILVSNTPGTLDTSVAEHTLWLLGSLCRAVAELDAEFHRGVFSPRTGMELHGKLLAIVGFGGVGRRVAAMASRGFGMRVAAVGARPADELASQEGRPLAAILADCGVSRYTPTAEDVLGQADVVSLHLPATAQTRHFINAQRLAQMKPGALLINTARGAVVDENALYDALCAGRLGGAGLDVFESEPYRPMAPDKDLRTLPHVVFTPHVASNTHEANARMARSCLATLAAFFAGRLEELPLV